MKKLKTIELANALGISSGIIKMNHKRGKLYRDDDDKTFDITHPVNKVWIDSQVAKGKDFDLNRILSGPKEKEPVKKELVKKAPVSDEVKKASSALSTRKLEADVLLKEREAEKKRLEIEKMMGLLIPTDAVRTVNIFIIETMRSTFLQGVNNIANVYIQKFEASNDDFVEIKKTLADEVQKIMEDAKENLKIGIDGIVKQWQDVKDSEQNK